MFCPKCAAQNVDGASFCRVCGANISLLPQALSGELPQAREDYRSRRSRRRERYREVEPSMEKGIMNVFMGIGFIVAALTFLGFDGVGFNTLCHGANRNLLSIFRV